MFDPLETLGYAREAEIARRHGDAAEHWRQLAEFGDREPARLREVCRLTADEARLRYGGALYQAGDLKGAVRIWEDLHKRQDSQPVLRYLTLAYLGLQRYQEGRATGEAFLRNDREDPEVWKTMGRIYACLAEEAQRTALDPVPFWRLAIDAMNEVLIAFNPLDEVAIEWKARCVEGLDGNFMPEIERRLEEFLSLARHDRHDEARRAIHELLPLVVEHVADLQAKDPERSHRTARDFLQLLRKFAKRDDLDLDHLFSFAIAQLKVLIMWACHAIDDHAGADDALAEARRFAPDRTLPYIAQAQLEFARGAQGAVEAPLERARACVQTEHDKYLMAQAYYALGQFSDALEWVDSVDLEGLRDQVYHPDRSVAAFRRFQAEVSELAESSDDLPWEELSPASIQLIIQRLLGDTSIE